MDLSVGKPLPQWRASACVGEAVVELAGEDFLGRWLLLVLYPMDFTFVCPTELRAFAHSEALLRDKNVAIVAMSTDSLESHQVWRSLELPEVGFPLVSDSDKSICRRFGLFVEERGVAQRATLLVDPQGVLRYFVVSDPLVGRSVRETLRVIEALQSEGRCGADWQPGDRLL